ncbi:FmdB family transcriptional regulator [Lentzea sp. NBC_00516]|uniref:FmdB family zinc ribbon protein n=1 Tax=Lentzea sp. NBC_00516 TaxID=2903582 RepID=UPI002E7FE5BE|nr:FmdB family zinc ribbon protein [Lentzea sp. NBC_00516]WUD22107.1 FmdB family transcriptional regulator [Lentzea sp. NBC_00516]
MPTYQYACTACEHRFEAVQSFSDSSLTECPECSGKLRKLFGAVGVVFKGSGFYRTDSRSGSSKSTAASSPSTETKSTEKKSAEKKSSSDSKASTSAPAAAAS